jgi:ankyrin repeat protein
MFKMMLSKEAIWHRMSPIHLAVDSGQVEVVKALIDAGANCHVLAKGKNLPGGPMSLAILAASLTSQSDPCEHHAHLASNFKAICSLLSKMVSPDLDVMLCLRATKKPVLSLAFSLFAPVPASAHGELDHA